MSPGFCSAGPPLLPFPLLCSASQALLFLTHARDIPDSGPLALLFPLPGMFFTWITMWWASPSPPLGHSLSVTFSVRPANQPLLPPPQNSTVLIFLHIPCHSGTHSIRFLLTLLTIQYLFSLIEKMLHEGRTFSLFCFLLCLAHLPSNTTSMCVSGCPPPANSCLSFLGDFLQCLGRLFRLEVLRINTHQGQSQPVGPGV